MKAIILALALTLSPQTQAADSILVDGATADALVNALTDLGLDPVGTHEYFQAGVTVCAQIFDGVGNYYAPNTAGEYVGESCLLYGDADGSDWNGRLQTSAIIPADDRELTRHPEIKQKLEKLRRLREIMESKFVPIVDTAEVNGREVTIARTTGIAGIACDGRVRGVRQCWVKPSERCPPKR